MTCCHHYPCLLYTSILTSQSKYDENSFENPTNVAPVTIPVTNVSNDFNYTFMRNSITVLVIPAEDAETTLESISVTAPAKTEYTAGEELDLAGMKVTANYSDGTTKDIACLLYTSSLRIHTKGMDSEKIWWNTFKH